MGILVVLALVFGRQNTPLVLLSASALAMTVVNPLTLGDIGFQLSLLATLGLILFTAPLQARWERYSNGLSVPLLRRAALPVADVLVVTLAAQITTLPLMVYYFGRLSLVTLLANALILPAQPPILAWGLLTLAGGLLWLPLGQVLAAVPWLFLAYTIQVVQFVARIPWIAVETGVWGKWLAVLVYAVLAVAFALRWLRRSGRSLTSSQRQVAAWACLLALPAVMALASLSGRPDGELHIYFLAGQRDEPAMVLTPGGRSVYVAGTGAPAGLPAARTPPGLPQPDLALAAVSPFTGVRAIDPATIAPGQGLQIEPGVTLERLGAGTSGAWLLRYSEFSLLMPAALSQEAQLALAKQQQAVRPTLLKLPGPATRAWPALEALEALDPQLVLVPQDATYPPAVTAYLGGRATASVPSSAMLEVVSNFDIEGNLRLTRCSGPP
jgi:ComEC/Rec2-related protein